MGKTRHPTRPENAHVVEEFARDRAPLGPSQGDARTSASVNRLLTRVPPPGAGGGTPSINVPNVPSLNPRLPSVDRGDIYFTETDLLQ